MTDMDYATMLELAGDLTHLRGAVENGDIDPNEILTACRRFHRGGEELHSAIWRVGEALKLSDPYNYNLRAELLRLFDRMIESLLTSIAETEPDPPEPDE